LLLTNYLLDHYYTERDVKYGQHSTLLSRVVMFKYRFPLSHDDS